jgi:hypothetical protein
MRFADAGVTIQGSAEIQGEIVMKMLLLVLVSTLLISCASTPSVSPQEMILGSWQARFEGQDMTLTYTEDEITVEEFGISFPYEWISQDQIKLDAMGQEVISQVEFITPDNMKQTSDQGVQMLTRVVK